MNIYCTNLKDLKDARVRVLTWGKFSLIFKISKVDEIHLPES